MGGYMYNKALEILKIFFEHGYIAYIVGGYPRDSLLGIKTKDIDICTNAKPKEIMEIFKTEAIDNIKYGSLRVIYKNAYFDVTTFRKDIKYENNRKPVKIKYINDLKKDLLRRDFTINTICIDKDGNYIDLLKAKEDIDKRIIRTVGNPRYRIKEDSLRILRAIRFACILDFTIDSKTKNYIMKYGYLLKNLSNSRKREELDKIFASKNKDIGKKLILELKLDKYLGLDNLEEVVMCDDILGIWSQIKLSIDYPFTKVEKDMIKKIKMMLSGPVNKITIYKYGLYVSTVVGSIRGISYQKINAIYKSLAIYTKKDIVVNGMDICNKLNILPDSRIKDITCDIEEKIVLGEIPNEYDKIMGYVCKKYS